MTPIKRRIAVFLSVIMCLSVVITTLASCTDEGTGETTTTTTTTTDPQNKPQGSENAYAVSIKTQGGMPLSGITFYVYKGEKDLVAYGTTDEKGLATVNMPVSDGYYAVLSTGILEGYTVAEKYPFSGTSCNIVLSSSVISDTNIANVRYKLGDVMRDFSVVTSDGTTFKLSEALKEKKAVLINFWYSTCSPCVSEFPYMQTVYERYSDEIDIIALNNYSGDNESKVESFKEEMGLTFNMAKDYSTLGNSFSLQGYPTSILVDRYGVICLIEVGGLPSEKPFTVMFDHFTSDNYQQQLFESVESMIPTETPDVEMPSSEEMAELFCKDGLSATFYPEKDSAAAEMSWPFVIGEYKGEKVIKTSNSFKDSSFATLYADIELKKGEALAFDYFSSTESRVDIMVVLIDGMDIYQISGVGDSWKTCYPYVALEDGTYQLALCYVKDSSTDSGDDAVYLKNLRTVSVDDIDTPSYIARYAATDRNEDGFGFQNYVSVFYNENDGYYHVNSVNGPLLLANLMDTTQFSDTAFNLIGYNGGFVEGDKDYYEDLVDYCNYALNSSLYGFTPVTEELKELLVKAVDLVGLEDDPNEWLQLCSYYDAYGTNGAQLEDPIKGLANFSAFEALESVGDEEIHNNVTYDRLIMPRGLKYKFTPDKSGVYKIVSHSDQEVNAWVFLEDGSTYLIYEHVDRFIEDVNNCSMIVYMEAGVNYYIDIAYYDVYATGSFTFTLKRIGDTYDHFRIASPGYFTYEESTTGELNEIIALGIDVVLGDDGYYHEDLGNGQLGSIIYADFIYSTGPFPSYSLQEMIELQGFNFALSETDHEVLYYMEKYGDSCEEKLREIWGDSFEENAEIYAIYDVMNGVYHGSGEDLTDEIEAYLDKMIEKNDKNPELEGCVAVDAELAELLQKIMDKYTFEGVDNSWTKLCYYYDHLG